ncbi:MAG TPA: 1,2-phenylacetyl-CoA epoxidase subunit PaaD [Allosphingosinicella sp.]|nr:1,2-phenylacetyl-CoA epoxidase subunit PaaD [Allosphingosinicella sp.]
MVRTGTAVVQDESFRSSRAKSRGAGTDSEQRPSTQSILSDAAGGVEGLGTNEDGVWQVLHSVPDPEIPVLSIVDLGIVRSVSTDRVTITPTYTGCPATQVIERDIRDALDAAGYRQVRIETVLAPPWTTDWITPEGRARLHAYGIAPPLAAGQRTPACPQCGSVETREISRFGSTPCKALWRCLACAEPFDLFKCH